MINNESAIIRMTRSWHCVAERGCYVDFAASRNPREYKK
jgi:hypothetical protein